MPWLKKHWIALSSPLLTALFLYLQIQQWKRHGDDYTSLTFSFIVTFLLWSALLIAIVRYFTYPKKRTASDTLTIEKAGVLKTYAGQADVLAKWLEDLWHLYNNEKKSLPNPLGKRVVPDEIKEWPDKQLWRFRVLYEAHVEGVKEADPGLPSPLIADGFPCDGQDYLAVKRKIEAHADSLRTRALDLLK